jgi:hypothetical protein
MPQRHRWRPSDFPMDEAKRLRAEGQNLYDIAAVIGWSYSEVRRKLKAAGVETFRHKRRATPNEPPADVLVDGDPAARSSADDSAESAELATVPLSIPDVPDNQETVQTKTLHSADTLANHETRLQALESFVKAIQKQARQPAVQHITVQSSVPSAYALQSAETVHTWDDPEDAKPERWNLWLPRGLKRRIEAQAKAAGVAPSQLVQRLLMAATNGTGVHDDA